MSPSSEASAEPCSLRLARARSPFSLPGYRTFETDINLVPNQKSTVKTDLVKGGAAEGVPLQQ
jgi:hypothetical protein